MSVETLQSLLDSYRNFIESNDVVHKIISHTFSSVDFIREHKVEITGASFVGFVALYLTKVWNDQRTFKRMGIKTPEYRFFFGHYKDLLEKGFSEALREWTSKHGKVYGIYEGHIPIMITADADMVQEIYIKQFSSFSARRQIQSSFSEDDPRINLFLSSKGRWKRQRNIINQTFTTARLKELFGLIKLCSDRFMEQIDQHTGKSIVPLTYLRQYAMDAIWNCALGVDIDCQRHPENPFYLKGVGMFDDITINRWNYRYSTYFHEFGTLVIASSFLLSMLFDKFTDSIVVNDSFSWMIRNISQAFEKRFALKTVRKDFVSILLENHKEAYDRNLDVKSSKNWDAAYFEKTMTLEEIKSNMIGFLLAGFETTSSTLNFCFYMMAKHPEELKKLQAEVDAHFKNSQFIEVPIDYDSLNELEYLDMFIKEVLRFFPSGNTVVGRQCTNSCIINGVYIPEKMTITPDSMSLHFDPEHWGPDAEEFNPSRFSPEIKRHPAAYLPFGLGPRTCVGMRFALLEVKLTLAKLLLKYDVVATPETPKELKFGYVMQPKTPIAVAINLRN